MHADHRRRKSKPKNIQLEKKNQIKTFTKERKKIKSVYIIFKWTSPLQAAAAAAAAAAPIKSFFFFFGADLRPFLLHYTRANVARLNKTTSPIRPREEMEEEKPVDCPEPRARLLSIYKKIEFFSRRNSSSHLRGIITPRGDHWDGIPNSINFLIFLFFFYDNVDPILFARQIKRENENRVIIYRLTITRHEYY